MSKERSKGRADRLNRGTAGVTLAASLVAVASSAAAQTVQVRTSAGSTVEFMAGEPAIGPIVTGAPYSGEATTTTAQTLADGTRIERTSSARVFRDSEGRMRREQTVQGLGALNPAGETSIITIVDPVAGVSYVLDPISRKARRSETRRSLEAKVEEVRRDLRKLEEARERSPEPAPGPKVGAFDPAVPPPPPPPPPPGARARSGGPGGPVPNAPQALGARQIEGVEVIGTKRVEVIPVGRIGNDRPIEITDERWESPALKVLVQSRHSDPRTGVVEYRLANISRAEPSRDLFVVPSDYTIVEARNDERR